MSHADMPTVHGENTDRNSLGFVEEFNGRHNIESGGLCIQRNNLLCQETENIHRSVDIGGLGPVDGSSIPARQQVGITIGQLRVLGATDPLLSNPFWEPGAPCRSMTACSL
jgi:hypothetical protein